MMKKAIAAAVWLSFTVVPFGYAWDIVASYPTPVSNPRGYQTGGILFGYVVRAGPTPYVYGFQLGTGSIVSSFPVPNAYVHITALTASGGYIQYIDDALDTVFVVDK